LRDDPGGIDTLLRFGRLLGELRRDAEAAEKYRRVLELDTANAEAHWRLGELAARSSRHAEAAAEFELAAQLDPERSGAQLRLAEARLRVGRVEEARRDLLDQGRRLRETARDRVDRVQQGDHGSDPATLELASRTCELLLEVGQPAEAVEVLSEFGTELRNDPDRLRLLALANFDAGHVAEGCAISRRVLRLEPNCVASMHNLALAAQRGGHRRLAWAWWRRGTRLAPEDEGLRRVRTRLVLDEIAHGMDLIVTTIQSVLAPFVRSVRHGLRALTAPTSRR